MHFVRYVHPLPDIHTHHALPMDMFQAFSLYQDAEGWGSRRVMGYLPFALKRRYLWVAFGIFDLGF